MGDGERADVALLSLRLERLDTRALTMATEQVPESDGTLVWSATTMVLVECRAGGVTGLGWTYENAGAVRLIQEVLAPAIEAMPVTAIPQAVERMRRAARNQGLPGLTACAIAAVDVALWDLKARLVGLPLADLLGRARERVPVYASGGFTSKGLAGLADEVAGYVAEGHQRVKIKIGRVPAEDESRVRAAREAAGPEVELMVDANGAYSRKQALAMAERLAGQGVVWFEEPVSSDDLDGLRFLRDRAPAGMAIAAGEYVYDATGFRRLLDAGAVDVLQADATRCQGVTGFLEADALCLAAGVPLSAHCAPALHAHTAAAARRLLHLEWFRDHARMESRLFEGAPAPEAGHVEIDRERPGLGVTLLAREAERHAA